MLLWVNQSFLKWSPQTIKDWILSLGAAGPIVYILLYTVRPLVLFPASLLSLAGGLAFGPVQGLIYTVTGASGGAMLAYMLAKKFGKSFIPSSDRIETVKKLMEKNGFTYVLILRLLPIVNFDLISYTAGIASIRWYSFLAATILGIIPGTFAYNFLGSSITEDKTVLIIAVMVFAVIAIIPVLFKEKLKQRLFQEGKNEVKKDA
nr:TVP38/TMEM64 family protein [Metabacillus mangrovi]